MKMKLISGTELLKLGEAMAGVSLVLHSISDLKRKCGLCGEPLGDHLVGGPGRGCPAQRTPLWFWN
jgi:hypothetical protein